MSVLWQPSSSVGERGSLRLNTHFIFYVVLVLLLCLFLKFLLLVCKWYVCVFVCMHVYATLCTWRAEDSLRCLLLPSILFEAASC